MAGLPALGLCLAVPPLPLPAHGELAARAERAGAAVLSVGESRYDSFATAALVASATTGVPVWTAVTTWARSPVATAAGALTLAELSGGRFTLGLGTMPPAWNRDFHGIDPARPLARLAEYVAVLRAAATAWAGAPVSVAGEFFTVTGYGAHRPEPPGHPVRVQLAVTRPGTARLAGRIADGVVVNVVHTVDWLADRLLPALAEGEDAAGRPVARAVMLRAVVHDGTAAGRREALAEAGASLEPYRPVPYFRQLAAAEGLDPDRTDDERLVRRFVAVGTVGELADTLAGYAPLVDTVLLTPASTLSPARARHTYDALLSLIARRRIEGAS